MLTSNVSIGPNGSLEHFCRLHFISNLEQCFSIYHFITCWLLAWKLSFYVDCILYLRNASRRFVLIVAFVPRFIFRLSKLRDRRQQP